jgi:hypothetical protein
MTLIIIIIIIIIIRMWNVKRRVIPVITGATGTISKSFRKFVSDIPGNHDVKELQKTAILGTSESANVTEQKSQTGTRNRGTRNNKDRIAATMYPLGTWFVSVIYVWIPCIKETMMMIMIIIIIMIIKFVLEQYTKAQRGSRGIALLFLQPRRLMWWVVNATPRPLYPRERPCTPCIGSWVGPRAGLDGCGKTRLHRDSIPAPSSP